MAEKAKALVEIDNPRLLGMEAKAVLGEARSHLLQGLLGDVFAPAQDDEVVGEAHEAHGRARLSEILVDYVQIEIGEQRRQRRALGDAATRRAKIDTRRL